MDRGVLGVLFLNGVLDVLVAPSGSEPIPDSDGDGVPDTADRCPNTPLGRPVDSAGCPPKEISLQKLGPTRINRANNYSEDTVLIASVIFPPGDPQAGQIDTSYNGPITFEEIQSGSKYYDGQNGASLLPFSITASQGRAYVILRSVSNSTSIFGPPDAMVKGTASSLSENAPTNPLAVDQWVDENGDLMYDWLLQRANFILTSARARGGELGAVANAVSEIGQYNDPRPDQCGQQRGFGSTVYVSPLCNGKHRLNTDHELSDTVLHESRHVWQVSQARRNGAGDGTDDDGDPATPSNDDDQDFLVEVTAFPTPGYSFNFIQEIHAQGGSGLDRVHDLDTPRICAGAITVADCAAEEDAVPFATLYKSQFP